MGGFTRIPVLTNIRAYDFNVDLRRHTGAPVALTLDVDRAQLPQRLLDRVDPDVSRADMKRQQLRQR